MKKFAQALFLALVVAAPVAISAPVVQAATPQATIRNKTGVSYAQAPHAEAMKGRRRRRRRRRPAMTSVNTHFLSHARRTSHTAKQA